jgi:DNA gyrase subunit B
MSESQNYGADSIQVLEGLEAVRKRPAMYIGDVGQKGLHHLVYEVVDNSIDEALAGHATSIQVTINESNSVTVKDDGRGIPVAIHTKENRSALEVVMTVLHAGGKFDKDSYKVSGGLHGVGVSCVNALSSLLQVNVHREGKEYQQEYSIGKPLYPVKEIGESDYRGTIVTFQPDASIFYEAVYQYDILAARLRELAYLNRGISIQLTDDRDKDEDGVSRTEEFMSEGGLREFVVFIDQNREALIPHAMYMEGEIEGIPVEVAMSYNTGYAENLHSYVNNINTHEGGTHLAGFRRAS